MDQSIFACAALMEPKKPSGRSSLKLHRLPRFFARSSQTNSLCVRTYCLIPEAMLRKLLAFWIVIAIAPASAQSAFETYGKLRTQAREAYLKKDYATAQPLLEQLYQFS